jgi:hypothetical protein
MQKVCAGFEEIVHRKSAALPGEIEARVPLTKRFVPASLPISPGRDTVIAADFDQMRENAMVSKRLCRNADVTVDGRVLI